MVKLAKNLAPEIRVNAVASGAILWSGHELAEQEIQVNVALRRTGSPDDITRVISYLTFDAQYMTGQVLTVDGGQNLFS